MKKFEWIYDEKYGNWLMVDEDGLELAEVGQEEAELEGDKSYYWIELESNCGYGDYDTLDEAKADAEKYFSKH